MTLTHNVTFAARTFVHNASIEYYCKVGQRELHIIDLDDSLYARSVTNAISDEFLYALLKKASPYTGLTDRQIVEMIETFQVFLYGTDGYVSTWKQDEGFTFVPSGHPSIYEKFYEMMIEIANKNRRGASVNE